MPVRRLFENFLSRIAAATKFGNTALLGVACRELRLKYGLKTFLMHPMVPPDHGGTSTTSELGMGIHAGLDETFVREIGRGSFGLVFEAEDRQLRRRVASLN